MTSAASPSRPLPATSDREPATSGPRSAAREARVATALELHFANVWRALRRLGVHESSADDDAQRVFLAFAQRLDEVEPGFERAYLLGIAVKVAANARRRQARNVEAPSDALDQELSSYGDPESLLQDAQRRRRLDEVLASFAPEQREVFVLYELEGFSLPEIARALQVPLGTATSRLRRARASFEAWVATHLPPIGEP
jgi:RNA polymerase sigma-70 factor, ECF subfamily